MLDRLKTIFTRHQPYPLVVFDSGERDVIDYTKENRTERVTYSGIGQTSYGSGFPPTIFDSPLAAVKAYPVVYAAITAISEAVSTLPIKVYEIKGSQRVEAQDHPFYQVFANPNPFQGSFEFLEQLQQSLDLAGNCYILKEPVAGSMELYILNPKYVAILPDPKIKVKGYRYYINGQSIELKPEDIIHIKYNDPADPYYGLPPLTAAADIITFEKYRQKYANRYFEAGTVPMGVIETDQPLGETVLKKLRVELNTLHGGVYNSHKLAILQNGLKYRNITIPIKELDFPGLKKLSREDILSIFKIPSSILGDQEGTGSKEGKDAITSFWRQCIIPRLKRIESGLNRGLKTDLLGEGRYVISFETTDVAALQDSKVDTANYLSTMVSSSIMTINESRAVVGLPALSDPYADVPLVSNSQFGNALMPVSEVGNQGAGSTKPKPGATPAGTTPVKPAAKPKPAANKPAAKPPAQ